MSLQEEVPCAEPLMPQNSWLGRALPEYGEPSEPAEGGFRLGVVVAGRNPRGALRARVAKKIVPHDTTFPRQSRRRKITRVKRTPLLGRRARRSRGSAKSAVKTLRAPGLSSSMTMGFRAVAVSCVGTAYSQLPALREAPRGLCLIQIPQSLLCRRM